MLHLADRRRGMTLLEVLFASGMTVFILGSVVFISLASAKATLIVTEQGQRQSQAALALDRMAEILRNAQYPVNIVSATEVRFTDARNPSDTQPTRIEWSPRPLHPFEAFRIVKESASSNGFAGSSPFQRCIPLWAKAAGQGSAGFSPAGKLFSILV
jgi:type II secretory pathway pseudopilin PulG